MTRKLLALLLASTSPFIARDAISQTLTVLGTNYNNGVYVTSSVTPQSNGKVTPQSAETIQPRNHTDFNVAGITSA